MSPQHDRTKMTIRNFWWRHWSQLTFLIVPYSRMARYALWSYVGDVMGCCQARIENGQSTKMNTRTWIQHTTSNKQGHSFHYRNSTVNHQTNSQNISISSLSKKGRSSRSFMWGKVKSWIFRVPSIIHTHCNDDFVLPKYRMGATIHHSWESQHWCCTITIAPYVE